MKETIEAIIWGAWWAVGVLAVLVILLDWVLS